MTTSGDTVAPGTGTTSITQTNTWAPPQLNAKPEDNPGRYIGLRIQCVGLRSEHSITALTLALTDLIQTSEPSQLWWKCLECSHLFRWPNGNDGVDPVTHLATQHGITVTNPTGAGQ